MAPVPPTSHPRAVSSSEEEAQAHKEFIEKELRSPELVSSSVTGNSSNREFLSVTGNDGRG